MGDAYELRASGGTVEDSGGLDLTVLMGPALHRWKTILSIGLLAGITCFGISYAIPNRYTAICVFLPPQSQPGGSAASALASLGSLSGLIGSGASKDSPDQYVALMKSATVADRIVAKFDLRKKMDVPFAVDARKRLALRTQITIGKKDGLISVEYTDIDASRAAAIANQYIEELRALTRTIAVTEAQQRRVFFERLLEQTRDKLVVAQKSLEVTGINEGALNVEPRSAADAYGRVRAELTAAQVNLQVLRSTLVDNSPEVRRQIGMVEALQAQLSKLEDHRPTDKANGDYISRYREFKYQETLFDLFARQYESARVDESRQGTLIQVVDPATPPERKSGPSHSMYGIVSTLIGLAASTLLFVVQGFRRRGRE